MKQFLLTAFTCLTLLASAQIPQAFNYQAVARNANGSPLANQNIGVKFTILDGFPNGTLVYMETQALTTNQFGLFTASVGSGTVVVGTFATIPWSTGHKYLKVEYDPQGGAPTIQLWAPPKC